MAWKANRELSEAVVIEHISDIKRYYKIRLREHTLNVKIDDADHRIACIRETNARCSASVGNSVMRAVRSIVVVELARIAEKKNSDMTVTLARNLSKAILGRSIDDRMLITHFGTEGRTASNKTSSSVSDFAEEVELLTSYIKDIKDKMLRRRTPLREQNMIKVRALMDKMGP